MGDPCDAIDRADEFLPAVALRREHLFAGRRQPIIPAPALSRFLDPAPADPAAFLQARAADPVGHEGTKLRRA